MRLRAITKKREKYYFDIKDCPVFINDKTVALMNKKNSPLLLANSIARGLDDEDVFEFDYVMDKKERRFLGYIVYTNEFCIYHIEKKTLTPMRDINQYFILSNTVLSDVDELEQVRSQLRFKCDNNSFGFKRLIYFHGNRLYTDIKHLNNFVEMDKVSFLTGLTKGKVELPYGKKLSDGEIVLNDFHPMVRKHDGTFRELEDKDYE